MIARSLAGAFYLVLLLFLRQDYAGICKMVSSITCDEAFPAEDQIVFNQLKAARADVSPNAHACRLKISLAVNAVHGTRPCPWDLAEELQLYLQKLDRVTSACRLSRAEERELLAVVVAAWDGTTARVAGQVVPRRNLRGFLRHYAGLDAALTGPQVSDA